MTRTELENAVRGLVQPRLGITAIWAHGTTATGAPVARPSGTYAMLNVVSSVAEGLPDGYGDAQLDDDTGDYLVTLAEDTYARVSVRVFGAGAWDKLRDLRMYLQTDTARELADTAGIGIAGLSELTDLTALDGAGWEPSCSLDVRIHYRETLTVDAGVMTTVRMGMTYLDGTTTVTTDTVEVSDE